MAIADERVDARRAEPASESGDVAGAEMLTAKHQHRMFGKSLLDPGECRVVELRQVDAERLGTESLPSGRNSGVAMGDPPIVCYPAVYAAARRASNRAY